MPLVTCTGSPLNFVIKEHIGKTKIAHQMQRGKKWCWAACTSMVLEGLGSTLTQCNVAGKGLYGDCSDMKAGPCNYLGNARSSCDVSYNAEDIESLWGKFTVTPIPIQGSISRERVWEELSAGYSIEILLGTSDSDGHLVLLIDFNENGMILVADPTANDVSPKSFEDIRSGLGWGGWSRTWLGLHFKKEEGDEIR